MEFDVRGELLVDTPSILASDFYVRGEPVLETRTIETRTGYETLTLRLRAFEPYLQCHWQMEAFGSVFDTGEFAVKVSWTRPNYGGRCARFECPRCNRKVRILYVHESKLACRSCSGVEYLSQRMRLPKYARPLVRLNEICVRLGGQPGELTLPSRPRGMHHKTYDRLAQEFVRYSAELGLSVSTEVLPEANLVAAELLRLLEDGINTEATSPPRPSKHGH